MVRARSRHHARFLAARAADPRRGADPRRDTQGKRKSSKPPPKKVAPKLDKLFTCPFCNHEKSVSAKLYAPARCERHAAAPRRTRAAAASAAVKRATFTLDKAGVLTRAPPLRARVPQQL